MSATMMTLIAAEANLAVICPNMLALLIVILSELLMSGEGCEVRLQGVWIRTQQYQRDRIKHTTNS